VFFNFYDAVNLGFTLCGSYIEQVKVNPGIYIKPDIYC